MNEGISVLVGVRVFEGVKVEGVDAVGVTVAVRVGVAT